MDVCREYCVFSGKVSATGRSLVQRIPTECGVSECDVAASEMRKVVEPLTIEMNTTKA